MLTIAGGIILAIVILAFLPELLGTSAVIVSAILLLALLLTVGYFVFANLSDALIILFLLVVAAIALVIFSVYAKSKNVGLFLRELALWLRVSTSPRKRAEKEFALEQLAKDIEAHCASRNEAITQKAQDDLLTVAIGVWNKFQEYGELTHSRTSDRICFASPQVGELFFVEVAANFPQEDQPTLLLHGEAREPERGTSPRELRAAIRSAVEWRLFEFERQRLRKGESTDASQTQS